MTNNYPMNNANNIKTKDRIYNNSIILLLSSITLNSFGLAIIQLYSLIYIYKLTNSNFYAALQGATIFGSGVASSMIYLRYQKKLNLITTMLNSEVFCFFSIMATVMLQNIPIIYITLLTIYLSHGFFKPAYQTTLYQVTQHSHIIKINNVSSILSNLALASGWIIAPLFYPLIAYSGISLIAAIAHLLSSACILILKSKIRKQAIQDDTKNNILNNYASNQEQPINLKSIPKNSLLPNVIWLILTITIAKSAIDALEMGIFRNIYRLSDMLIGIFFIFWILGGGISRNNQQQIG